MPRSVFVETNTPRLTAEAADIISKDNGTFADAVITNVLVTRTFTGTVQIGTNFYMVKDLQPLQRDESWTNIEVSYGDKFWRPLPTDGIITIPQEDLKYYPTIKLRLRGNHTTYAEWEKDYLK